MPPNRLSSNRMAWDHTVLSSRSGKLDWKKPERAVETTSARAVQPWWGLAAAWGLLAWSGVTAWSLWTSNHAESHISMRFLMNGDFEEIAGVISGLLWAGLPAAAAWWLARRAREITMDEIGARTYWASLAVLVVAWMGLMRPTWDGDAGSRIVRVRPAEGGATQAAADASANAAGQSSAVNDGFDVVSGNESAATLASSGFGELRMSEGLGEMSGAPAGGVRNLGRSRAMAMRRAAMQAQADAAGSMEQVPVFGPTAEAAGFGEGP